MKLQKGFTLIELVIVIIILGILAAFVLPKFGSIERDARTATVQGLEGSMRGAAAIVHSTALVQGITTGTVQLGGTGTSTQPVKVINGYPEASADGIDKAIENLSGFDATGGGAGATDVRTFAKIGASGTCNVTYTAAAANAVPAIVATSSGC